MDLTVCICTRDRPSQVGECLNGLYRQTLARDRFAVLVVDSASSASAAAELERLARSYDARLIRLDQPGVSMARNAGAWAARTPFIAYIDDDAIPAPDWVEAILTSIAEAGRPPALIGGRILPKWEAPLPAWWPASLRGVLAIVEHEGHGEYRTAAVPTNAEPYAANMVVHVLSLLAAGGFDGSVGRYGQTLLSDEDVQLAWALQDAGYSVRYDSRIVVYHQNSAPPTGPGMAPVTPLLAGRIHGRDATLAPAAVECLARISTPVADRSFTGSSVRDPAPFHVPAGGPLARRLCHGLCQGRTRMARHRVRDQASGDAGERMILYRWRGPVRNFGDELNTILWPRLLPDFFDDDPAICFLGIGSILDERHPPQAIKVVAGSGYGGYRAKPRLDQNWVIHWVRGPRTAAALDLPLDLALGDPAVLVPLTFRLEATERRDIGFMPHAESAEWGSWEQAAELAGLRLIDPREPPDVVLQAIGRCRLLLSEALHGAVVADAMRVPWIAIRPSASIHRAKWLDWAAVSGFRPRFLDLPTSTLLEWAGTSRFYSFHATRAWLSRHQHGLATLASERLATRAANALRLATTGSPQLSSDVSLDRCQSRMLDAINAVRMRPLEPDSARLNRGTIQI